MSQYKKIISLKKAIRSSLGKIKAEKYLRGIEIMFSGVIATSNSMNMYQYALSQLLEGETEKALNCIIFILDTDRDNKLALHLCKTMLFSLTQYMSENNLDKIKLKYDDDIDNNIIKLKRKYKELEKIISNEESDLEKLEKTLMKNRSNLIFKLFKRGGIKTKAQDFKRNLSNYNHEFEQIKSELSKLEELVQREEFIKVVGLIIEICIFPSRFDPDLIKTNYM